MKFVSLQLSFLALHFESYYSVDTSEDRDYSDSEISLTDAHPSLGDRVNLKTMNMYVNQRELVIIHLDGKFEFDEGQNALRTSRDLPMYLHVFFESTS